MNASDLFRQIQSEIAQNGVMPFERYMQLALYDLQYGYYRQPSEKIGAQGDFVTAPEISALFSFCVAIQCQEVLVRIPEGCILEFGAGRGTLCADILLYLERQNALPKNYYILEISAYLTSVQKTLIKTKVPHLMDRVIWLNRLPHHFQGIVLANEVLDAMPVTLFKSQANKIVELGVNVHQDQFVLQAMAENKYLTDHFNRKHIDFPDGYVSEINLQLAGWISSIAESMAQGVVLLIDYGFPEKTYYHPDRMQGTLMCHYQHRSHPDPFFMPGFQDITCHVDFTAVAEAATECGLQVTGFVNQANFLMNAGLLDLLDQSADDLQRYQNNQSVLKLTLPSEMGELFKVMGLTKSYSHDLKGFQQHNRLNTL